MPLIDLRSDTVTRPCNDMLAAMMAAETGDEQRGDDPTVNQLCDRFSERLGKEAAIFLPSGTMANQIAILLHCRPGDEIIAAEDVHISYSEGGGAAALAGAQLRLVPHKRGHMTATSVVQAIRPKRRQTVRSRLIVLEQTFNRPGGVVLRLPDLLEIREVADTHDLAIHMDGARLFNAEVASGVEAKTFASVADTVFVDLTKGLGCPFGAVLVGSKDTIEEAWRHKVRLGGGMRQAGIMAAAGLFALDNNIARLKCDHDLAKVIAKRLTENTDLTISKQHVETNIVLVSTENLGQSAGDVCRYLARKGILTKPIGPETIRFTTHRDVREKDLVEAVNGLGRCKELSLN